MAMNPGCPVHGWPRPAGVQLCRCPELATDPDAAELRRIPRGPNNPAEAAQMGEERWVQIGWWSDRYGFSYLEDKPADDDTAAPAFRRELVQVGDIRKWCPVCGVGTIGYDGAGEMAGFTCGHADYTPAVRVLPENTRNPSNLSRRA